VVIEPTINCKSKAIKKMKKQLIYTALAITTLSACTQDEEQIARLESPVEATFVGQVNLASTRGDAWTEDYASIGISAKAYTNSKQKEADYENVLYTVNKLGEESATLSTSTKFYFQTADEKASFVAYAPYVNSASDDYANGIITVQAEDASAGKYNVPDYIWAETGDLDYNSPKASLQFTHQMVKLNITATLSSEISDIGATIRSVSLSNLRTDGTFNLATGEVATAKNAIPYSFPLTVSTEDATQATLTDFIALPQSDLLVTIIDSNGNAYQSTLTQSLTSGNAYSITVTAKMTGLIVVSTFQEWTYAPKEEKNTMMIPTPPIGEFTDPDETYLYDLVFSDGSFLHSDDADGNILSNTYLHDMMSERRQSKAIGMVCSKIDMTSLDSSLKADYPNCTHGLIIALEDACDDIEWMDSSFTEENNNLTSSSDYGYESTKILQAYNDSQSDETKKIKPIVYLAEYAEKYPSPSNCSPWFIGNNEVIDLFKDIDVLYFRWWPFYVGYKNYKSIRGNCWLSDVKDGQISSVRYGGYVTTYSSEEAATATAEVRAICAF
jgi:hypothetical protein